MSAHFKVEYKSISASNFNSFNRNAYSVDMSYSVYLELTHLSRCSLIQIITSEALYPCSHHVGRYVGFKDNAMER